MGLPWEGFRAVDNPGKGSFLLCIQRWIGVSILVVCLGGYPGLRGEAGRGEAVGLVRCSVVSSPSSGGFGLHLGHLGGTNQQVLTTLQFRQQVRGFSRSLQRQAGTSLLEDVNGISR